MHFTPSHQLAKGPPRQRRNFLQSFGTDDSKSDKPPPTGMKVGRAQDDIAGMNVWCA